MNSGRKERGTAFPVGENSPRRGKHEENGPLAPKTARAGADRKAVVGGPRRTPRDSRRSLASNRLPQEALMDCLAPPHTHAFATHGAPRGLRRCNFSACVAPCQPDGSTTQLAAEARPAAPLPSRTTDSIESL